MRFALTVSLACAALTTSRAAEPTTPAAGESAIEMAKRDFDTVKAERERALQPKGELRLASPELQLEGLEPRATDQTGKKKLLEKELADKKAKAAHWLVDAMEKERDLDSQEKSGVSRADRDKAEVAHEQERTLELLRGEKPGDQLALGSRDADTKTAKDARPAAPAINPLTRYMGDWMTPQDFALLKPNLSDGAAKDAFTPGGTLPGSGALSATELATAGGVDLALGAPGSTRTAPPLAPPRENPFLPGLASVGAPPPTLAPPSGISLGPPPGSPSVFVDPTPPPAPARSNVPDFAKPSADDKYFKPLKRF